MIELVYLVCWSFTPIPTDCRVVRVPQGSVRECIRSVNNMKDLAPAWCDTGREPRTVKTWLRGGDNESI